MAFFKALTSIGIDRTQLAAISDESLIRIEKKLIAEQKLNNIISKNDVEQTIHIIKDYPDVLKEISRYDCLYGILNGYDAEYIDTLARYTPEQTERIKLVVSEYFTEEITAYINLNISLNNWNNIRVLLHYSVFLNNSIIKMLTLRLEAKVEAAIGKIQLHITDAELRNKFNYLNDKYFYFTLGEVNKQYFLRVLVRLIDVIKQNPGPSTVSSFFKETKLAMRWYDTNNRALANKLGLPLYQPQSTTVSRTKLSAARIIYIIIIISSALFNLTRSCNSTTNTFTPDKSLLSNERLFNPTADFDSVRLAQRLKMKTFLEARWHPVNFPTDSLKTASGNIRKYQNPFGLDIFNSYYAAIKNGLPAVAIINRTEQECVVIAYYMQQYDDQQKTYERIDRDKPLNIFPLYIPAHDSISVDLNMTLIRFYMGQRLTAYKSSPRYNNSDSTDLKFSRFSRADSMLFSKAFWLTDPYNVKSTSLQAGIKKNSRKKMTLLTITQPSLDSYKLSWSGNHPLYEYAGSIYQLAGKRTDSATRKKPLIYDLKNQPPSPGKNEINSFIEY